MIPGPLVSLAALAAALLALSAPARAEEVRAAVVLVRPPAAPRTVTETLVHLHGELEAAGFAARIVEAPVGTDVRASLEQITPGPDAVAVVAVLPVSDDPAEGPGPEMAAAEMWVIDRLTGKTVVRRASAAGDRQRAAEILSVRAVELLRASFIELAITSMAQRAPAVAAPAAQTARRWVDKAIDERQRPWSYGLELGGAVMASPNGVGPTILPLLRVERAFGESLVARASAAGLGAPARVSTPGGFADVTQTLFLAEASWRFRAGSRVQPLVTVGAGALGFAADGHAMVPAYRDASGTRWAPIADVGVGARFSIHRRLDVGAELHALAAQPYPSVQFQGNEVAHAGRPSLMASFTVLGGL